MACTGPLVGLVLFADASAIFQQTSFWPSPAIPLRTYSAAGGMHADNGLCRQICVALSVPALPDLRRTAGKVEDDRDVAVAGASRYMMLKSHDECLPAQVSRTPVIRCPTVCRSVPPHLASPIRLASVDVSARMGEDE